MKSAHHSPRVAAAARSCGVAACFTIPTAEGSSLEEGDYWSWEADGSTAYTVYQIVTLKNLYPFDGQVR